MAFHDAEAKNEKQNVESESLSCMCILQSAFYILHQNACKPLKKISIDRVRATHKTLAILYPNFLFFCLKSNFITIQLMLFNKDEGYFIDKWIRRIIFNIHSLLIFNNKPLLMIFWMSEIIECDMPYATQTDWWIKEISLKWEMVIRYNFKVLFNTLK